MVAAELGTARTHQQLDKNCILVLDVCIYLLGPVMLILLRTVTWWRQFPMWHYRGLI